MILILVVVEDDLCQILYKLLNILMILILVVVED